jgi:hypothetical protein
MWELLITLAILGALVGMPVLLLIPMQTAAPLFTGLIVVGMGVGVPTGVVYHVMLWRTLQAWGQSTRGLVWNPVPLHDRVPAAARGPFLVWFWIAGGAFVLVVLGLAWWVALAIGLLMAPEEMAARMHG